MTATLPDRPELRIAPQRPWTTRADRTGRRRVRARAAWAAGVGAALGAALAVLVHRGLADDAYITLAIARNVAERGEWAVTPGLLSNTATSPLHVLLLAAAMLVVGSPIGALTAVLTASTAVTSWAVTRIAQRCGWAWWAGPLAVVLLTGSPLMAATVGLESFLVIALLALLTSAVHTDRTVCAGLLCGLLALSRPDAGVFAAAAAVAVLLAHRRWLPGGARRVAVMVALAVAVVAPWAATSVWLFATPIPDTLAWKTEQQTGLAGTFYGDSMPLFLDRWTSATALTLVLVALGVVALLGWAQVAPAHPVTVVLGGGAALHAVTLSLLGVPPFAWYYAPVVAGAALLVGLGAAALLPRRLEGRTLGVAIGVPLTAVVVGTAAYAAHHDHSAIPFHANYATAGQYAAITGGIPDGAVVQTSHGEIGAIAFYCHERCTAVDPLSDRGRLAPTIAAALDDDGLRGTVLRVLYSGWAPTEPVQADLQTVSTGPGGPGFPIWSGFGGDGHLLVLPAE